MWPWIHTFSAWCTKCTFPKSSIWSDWEKTAVTHNLTYKTKINTNLFMCLDWEYMWICKWKESPNTETCLFSAFVVFFFAQLPQASALEDAPTRLLFSPFSPIFWACNTFSPLMKSRWPWARTHAHVLTHTHTHASQQKIPDHYIAGLLYLTASFFVYILYIEFLLKPSLWLLWYSSSGLYKVILDKNNVA